MNNIKIGLTALAGSLVAGSVSAATMSVSGSAGMSFTGGDEKKTEVKDGLWVIQLHFLLQEMQMTSV